MLSSNEIRKSFIDFFVKKNHKHLPSSSLIPNNDPTVLLTTAGMLQFKPIMFGIEQATYPRVTTFQKCFRTSDLENVGFTARHHTFFEMLGNFSFGDYYKKEAISWAWEFIMSMKINKEKLWVSVFKTDDEAANIWEKEIGIPSDRIIRLGEDSNFWQAGPTGPCGPCSEIIFDLGEDNGCGKPTCNPACDCGRYLEIWNLVFMELNRLENGELIPLPSKNIDTGMGFERLVSIVQGVSSNYETDIFMPLISLITDLTGVKYKSSDKTDIALKVISDHIRAITHLISDGVYPSNEGRGYVLRRILRRAVRYGKVLGLNKPFLLELLPEVIRLNSVYPDLKKKEDYIKNVISSEENNFNLTLERGTYLLENAIEKIKKEGKNLLSGKLAFELYDTYGFPLELTQEIGAENGLKVDITGYKEEMEKQIERSRINRLNTNIAGMSLPRSLLSKLPDTEFTGYHELQTNSTVIAVIPLEETSVAQTSTSQLKQIILDKSPFYVESGGQVSDTGWLECYGEKFIIKNLYKAGEIIVHVIEDKENKLKEGDKVIAIIEGDLRQETSRHHSVTHLMHKSLKIVLGEHVEQSGSFVGPNITRFDFTNPKGLTEQEIKDVESLVNEQILKNLPVNTLVMPIEQAKKTGAVALFGEKYGEKVRVVSMGEFSKELCGGTHVKSTGEIGIFKIISEEAIAAGIRRISAIVGKTAYNYIYEHEMILKKISSDLKTPVPEIYEKVIKMTQELNKLKKELENQKKENIFNYLKNLVKNPKEINGIKYITHTVQSDDMNVLRKSVIELIPSIDKGIIVLVNVISEKLNFIVAVNKNLVKLGFNAGNIVKEIGQIVGAKGGGSPEIAQAGGGDINKLQNALDQIPLIIENKLNIKK